MDETIPFKERVRRVAIQESAHYKQIFIDYDYLICCESFAKKNHYVIAGERDNYAHLLGVNTLCSSNEFFNKCITGNLVIDDFDFSKIGQSEKEVKGTVRRKISSLSKLIRLFDGPILVEESFKKNNVMCAIAATDMSITIGFSSGKKSYPMTLLKGNELSNTAVSPTLILRRISGRKYFDQIIYGNKEDLELFRNDISLLLHDNYMIDW